MSTGEIRAKNGQSAAELRTHDMATAAANKAYENAQNLLTCHDDIVPPEVRATIVSREQSAAYNAVVRARETGRLNDTQSEKPGITVFFTRDGAQQFIEEASNPYIPAASYFPDYAKQIQPVDDDGTVFSLRFPTGTYDDIGNVCHINGRVENIGGIEVFKDPLVFNTDQIARIEGDSGELWQNRDYQADGSPVYA